MGRSGANVTPCDSRVQPMTEYNLGFSPTFSRDCGSIRLLELPPGLCSLIESTVDDPLRCVCPILPTASLQREPRYSFTIKGLPNDDAVLCTAENTYTLRSVVLSNSVLVITAATSSNDGPSTECVDVVIQDQLSEIMELVPSIPKLHKLGGLLKGMEYDDSLEEMQGEGDQRPVSACSRYWKRRYLYCANRTNGESLHMRKLGQKYKRVTLN